MPSRRQSSAMLSSPRSPSSTMRILSAAEKCRRVARRISFTTCSAGPLAGADFCLIFAPLKGYDEPEILPSSTRQICLIGADAGHDKDPVVEQLLEEALVDQRTAPRPDSLSGE